MYQAIEWPYDELLLAGASMDFLFEKKSSFLLFQSIVQTGTTKVDKFGSKKKSSLVEVNH